MIVELPTENADRSLVVIYQVLQVYNLVAEISGRVIQRQW